MTTKAGDMGFARNIQALFGYGHVREAVEGMLNRPLKSVEFNKEKDKVTFTFLDGHVQVFLVEGDCCSQSWIEHWEVPDNIEGAQIIEATDGGIDKDFPSAPVREDAEEWEKRYETGMVVDEHGDRHECLQVYETTFTTDRGVIRFEYRNSSNGYYGGYLTVPK